MLSDPESTVRSYQMAVKLRVVLKAMEDREASAR